ncbi:uncharacterized protein LOC134830110 [Culicoides brevitarsis]|uniref:uncharacterized protein LOC134830110 n=1 Tax=Culicoides brevitarsis TaxID=469753 RepID=UPI00307C4CD3
MSEQNNDSSLDDSVIDKLSDDFLELNIRNDEELKLQYQMLGFIYKKNYLKYVHLAWVWREFLTIYPQIPLSDMELKLEFCIRVLANIEKFPLLSPEQVFYFKSRIFNPNVDDLLTKCDLESGLDYVMGAEAAATILPFDVQTFLEAESVDLFGKRPQTGPIPLRRGVEVEKSPDRSLTQLLRLLFLSPAEFRSACGMSLTNDNVKSRIEDGLRRRTDFIAFVEEHFKSLTEDETTPTERQIEVQPISTAPLQQTPDFNVAISSTPLTHTNVAIRRTLSQPIAARTRAHQDRDRATSADRTGESLNRFTERMKARSKPKSRRLRM